MSSGWIQRTKRRFLQLLSFPIEFSKNFDLKLKRAIIRILSKKDWRVFSKLIFSCKEEQFGRNIFLFRNFLRTLIEKVCTDVLKTEFYASGGSFCKNFFLKKNFLGRPDLQSILCTINFHTKKQLMVIPSVTCFFFYIHSMESLSTIKLYAQLKTLSLFCMVIQWFSCFSGISFDKKLPISYLYSSDQCKGLENFKSEGEFLSKTLRV